jgi:hypothetical protein
MGAGVEPGAGIAPRPGNAAIPGELPRQPPAREPARRAPAGRSRTPLLPSKFSVRRAVSIALVLILVFAAAVLAGFWAAARLAPERLRLVAEQQLGRVLKGEVTLASLQIARASRVPWLWLEAHGARAVLQNDVTLLAGRMRARLDPLSLALGRLGIADLRLEDVVVMFPPHDDGKGPQDRVRKILHPIEVTGRFLREHPCSIPDLEVEGLTLLVARDGKLDVVLESGRGSLACAGLARSHSNARLLAQARRGDGSFPASFTLAASRDTASADVVLDSVAFAPLLGIIGLNVPLRGTVSGTAHLEAPGEGPYRLDVALQGRQVAGPIPGGEHPPWLSLDLPAPRLSGRLLATQDDLKLESAEIADGGIRLELDGELEVPVRPASRARLAVEAADLAVGDATRLLTQLPETAARTARQLLARVEAGRFPSLSSELRGTLGEISDLLQRSVLSRPDALRVAAALDGATLRLGEGDRASDVRARLDFVGDRLALSVTQGSYHEHPMPRLALTLTGIRNVRSFEEVNCHTPRKQPDLAGLARLRDWLGEERSDPEERSTTEWRRLSLDLDWVSHPILLCGLEQVEAVLTPAPEGLRFEVSRGVWAGLPIQIRGRWERATQEAKSEAVMLTAQLGPPFEAMSLDPPADPWLSGRYVFETTRLGRWHVRGASGRVVANGTRVDLPGTTLELAKDVEIQGQIGIDLGVADTVPFSAQAQFAGVDLLHLWQAADFERGALAGTLYGAGAIEGELRPGLNPLGDARGLLAMHARDGQIQRKIPLMLAIAIASDQFNPFGNREELPYQAIDAVARVKKGNLVFDSVQVHSTTLRMGATGKGGVVEPYALQGVVGLFFFPGLDSLIERVPILNRVILGRDANFVGAYFSVTGAWGAPEASLIPSQLLATGPAGILTEGIPGFVLGGIRRIQAVVLPSEPAEPPPSAGGRADS